MKRYEVIARVGSWASVTLRVEAIDMVDALSQSHRELFDGTTPVVWISCRQVSA